MRPAVAPEAGETGARKAGGSKTSEEDGSVTPEKPLHKCSKVASVHQTGRMPHRTCE